MVRYPLWQFNTLQANPKQFLKIKRASVIDYAVEKNSHTFNEGKVYLYTTVDAKGNILFYQVGDESRAMSEEFKINQHRTVATEDAISIKYKTATITLTLDGDTFAFYRKLFPFEMISVSIHVH